MMKDERKEIQKALIKLYQMLKVRKEDEAKSISKEQLQEEEIALQTLPLKTIVAYIKSSVDIKIAIEVERQCQLQPNTLQSDNANNAEFYETLLQKEEKEIREHISMEHQLKIYVEKIEQSLGEVEQENNMLKQKLKKYSAALDKEKKHHEENNILQNQNKEISNLKKVIQTLEDQKADWCIKENKLITQLNQKDKELKRIENKIAMRRSASLFLHKDKNYNKYTDNNNQFNDISSQSSSICSNSRSKRKITDDLKYRTEGHEISLIKDKSCSVILNSNPHQNFNDKLKKYTQSFSKKQNDGTRNKGNIVRSVSSIPTMSYHTKNSHNNNNDNYEVSTQANYKEMSQRLNDSALHGIMAPNTIQMKKIPLPNYTFVKKTVIVNSKKRHGGSVTSTCHNRDNNRNSAETLNHKRIQESSSIPILINQSEIPCVNNFNIYNGSGHNDSSIKMTSYKNNSMNLRQYIFAKGETNKMKKMRNGHNNKY